MESSLTDIVSPQEVIKETEEIKEVVSLPPDQNVNCNWIEFSLTCQVL